MKKSPKNILIIRFSAMGDVVMTVPVVQNLLDRYPNTQITLLTKPFFHPFFEGIPNINVYPVDLKGKHKGVKGLYKLVQELTRTQKFDAIIDIHSVMRSWIIGLFFRFKGVTVYKIDKGRAEKKAFIKKKTDKPLIHTSQRYQNVFVKAGFSFTLEKKLLPVLTESNAVSKLDFSSISIGIAPFAAHKSKEWGIDKVKELIEKINEKHSVSFYLFGGGKNEVEQLKKLASSFKNVYNLAGKFSLKEEIQLLRKLTVFIGMDSGNAHIAALTGIPVITIWGGTHPKLGFKPMYQADESCILPKKSILDNCPISVYGTSKPQLKESPYFCIRSIDVERVYEVVKLEVRS